MRSSEMFLELWLLRYRAKGRNEQNVVGGYIVLLLLIYKKVIHVLLGILFLVFDIQIVFLLVIIDFTVIFLK
jgi:hypothetical protein